MPLMRSPQWPAKSTPRMGSVRASGQPAAGIVQDVAEHTDLTRRGLGGLENVVI
jgi:hypothetical protein